MGILDGIVGWIAEQVMNILDMITTSVLGALGTSMDTFLRYFPAAETMYDIFTALSVGIILLNLVWQLFKNFGLGIGIEAEDPIKLTMRSVFFIMLACFADEIIGIALSIAGTPYNWILTEALPPISFADFNSVLLVIIGVCANGAVAIIALILVLMLAWNYIKLLFEAAERYILLGVLVYTAPIAFLKISQKIDSFMSSLGINVGNTGGSMLSEAMLVGKAIGGIKQGFGASTEAGKEAGNKSGGLSGAVGRRLASGATGVGSGGILASIGGKMFEASLGKGGEFANDVIGGIAKGDISRMGSITGEKASKALTSYLGLSNQTATGGLQPTIGKNGASPKGVEPSDNISLSGNMPSPFETPMGDMGIPSSPAPETQDFADIPTFENVEIGGGRITGREVSGDQPGGRDFAMYNAEQYMKPDGDFQTVKSVDGSKWYKHYAEDTVKKTPYMKGDKIAYKEEITSTMPKMPRRKDRV